jgi:hypothetical protein
VSVNEFLAPTWSERVVRLAVGVEPVDGTGRQGFLPDLELALERVPRPHPVPAGAGQPGDYQVGIDLPQIHRSRSGRFAVTYLVSDLASPVAVRLFDPGRRFVPRRLAFPLLTEDELAAQELAHASNPWPPITGRAFRPALFPGAAYGTQAGATVIRGRAVHPDGSPVRWCRVHATDAAQGTPLGWAHGDDRGEFLLVLTSSDAQLVNPASSQLAVDVAVRARPLPVPPDTPARSPADPLWDLVVETLPTPGDPDPVSDGRTDPAGFTAGATATLTVVKGRVTRPSVPFVVT